MTSIQRKIRVNERIRVPRIRLIGANGEQIGIVPVEEGLRRAEAEGLDLVEVSPDADPPVCRIVNCGKYLYSLNKREKEAKKKQKIFEVKEIKVSPKIGEHDYQTKLRSAVRFLSRKDKVKLTMFFRGRELAHVNLGEKIIQRLIGDLEEYGEVEKRTGLEGSTIVVLVGPKRNKQGSLKGGSDAQAQDEKGGQKEI